MRIGYKNLIDGAEAIVASSEMPGFPVENLQEQRPSKVWSPYHSGSAQTVTIDLGEPKVVSFAAVIGHNLTVSASTVIKGNDTDIFSPASVSSAVAYNSGVMLTFFSAPETYRYWQFEFDDPTHPEDIFIGRIWLGEYITIDPSSLLNFTVTKRRSDDKFYSKGHQKFARVGVGWREFDLSFPRTDNTMISLISDFYDFVGKHSSFVFCNFDTIRGYPLVEPCYCSVAEDVGFSHQERMHFTYQLRLEEDR